VVLVVVVKVVQTGTLALHQVLLVPQLATV
jgi:hypothetical protein